MLAAYHEVCGPVPISVIEYDGSMLLLWFIAGCSSEPEVVSEVGVPEHAERARAEAANAAATPMLRVRNAIDRLSWGVTGHAGRDAIDSR